MARAIQSGSSLLELLIVFGTIALLMTMVIAQVPSIKRYAIRAEIEKLRSAFWYLGQRAQIENKDFVISFDIPNSSYRVDDRQHKLPSCVRFGAAADIYGPPSDPKNRISSAITFKDNRAVFHPDGTISSGTIYLYAPESKNSYALTLPVGLVSYIRLYRYQREWKLIE
ncbi:type II secretion system protein [Candidatus Dependentiae bacterium]|nr:type II secretion system protein [Candidatus Dependentiae bacterium]